MLLFIDLVQSLAPLQLISHGNQPIMEMYINFTLTQYYIKNRDSKLRYQSIPITFKSSLDKKIVWAGI